MKNKKQFVSLPVESKKFEEQVELVTGIKPCEAIEPIVEFKKSEKPEFFLVVLSPFRDYKRGDMITNVEEVKKIESCHEFSMTTKIKAQ